MGKKFRVFLNHPRDTFFSIISLSCGNTYKYLVSFSGKNVSFFIDHEAVRRNQIYVIDAVFPQYFYGMIAIVMVKIIIGYISEIEF